MIITLRHRFKRKSKNISSFLVCFKRHRLYVCGENGDEAWSSLVVDKPSLYFLQCRSSLPSICVLNQSVMWPAKKRKKNGHVTADRFIRSFFWLTDSQILIDWSKSMFKHKAKFSDSFAISFHFAIFYFNKDKDIRHFLQ